MATFFELPPSDVIFEHIFVKLETIDIWKLRLTCRKLHELCWDYFSNACKSLKICLSTTCATDRLDMGACSFLDVGAGINIMHISKHLRTLEIFGPCSQHKVDGFVKLLNLLRSGMKLKRLKLKHLDLTCTVPHLDGLSKMCSNLLELELGETVIKDRSIQQFLSQVLQHNRNLQKLTLNSITFSLNIPLPTNSLTALRHFSVSLFTVCHSNVYTCTSYFRLLTATI